MVIQDVELPDDYFGFGSRFGAMHRTSIQEGAEGDEFRVQHWNNSQRRYEVQHSLKSLAKLQELQDFVIARQGHKFAFKFRDPFRKTTFNDHRSEPLATDVLLAIADGVTTTFGLFSAVGQGTDYEVLTWRRYIGSDLKVSLSGVDQTEGVDFTADRENGEITFLIPPPAGEGVMAGFEYFTVGRFDLDLDEWLQSTVNGFESGSVRFGIVEEKWTKPAIGHYASGAGKAHTQQLGTDKVQIDEGLFHLFVPLAAMDVRLPDVTRIGPVAFADSGVVIGGPYFSIYNASPTNSLTLKERHTNGLWRSLLQNAVVGPNSCMNIYFVDGTWRAA